MKYEIVTLPAFRTIGLKWEGTFEQIQPNLKHVIQQATARSEELQNKVHPLIQLGLSYHTIENGFVHYAVFEVTEEQLIPDGMLEFRVPELTYVKTSHAKGLNIQSTYSDLHEWLINSDYTAYKEADVIYYDEIMPIKHEHYPVDRDMLDEHFDIYIPVVKKFT